MPLPLPSLLGRLFKRKSAVSETENAVSFAERFHRFKLFLSAYLEAYGEMMGFEERLAGELPFGMPFLRMCTARMTVASMQCLGQLNALGGGRFSRLNEPFSRLRREMQDILDRGIPTLEGPLVLPFAELGEEHQAIVAPSLAKLSAIRDQYPEFLPKGFVLTGSAWARYFSDQDMHDEIDRIMVISQDDPGSYSEAAATIRERLHDSFPLPPEIRDAILDMADRQFSGMNKPGQTLLLRGMPVFAEHSALVMPEQLLHTPVDMEELLNALRDALVMTFRARAMICRLKQGIRARSMPLCVSVTAIPRDHGRGSAHRKLETLNPEELCVHVRRGFSTPESWPSQASVEGASLPEDVMEHLTLSARRALGCLTDAPVRGNRHELFWVAGEMGCFYVHGVNALPDPVLGPESSAPPTTDEAAQADENVIVGGLSAYPGQVRGPVFIVRNFTDALNMPLDSILVLPQASPRWSFLLDFASGAIAGDGTGNGLFARTARRYGRPTVLGQPRAYAELDNGREIRIRASADYSPRIEKLPDAAEQGQQHSTPTWLPDSGIANMARELAPKIAKVTLPDSDNVDFRAENCKTFHDILLYCQVHAVREMYRAGTSARTREAPAKQLVCDVPKQFWIINLDDGFFQEIRGPMVQLEQIASLPMRSLWRGFSAKTWEGPPQLNARGFLSVLFEATANPNLDPASQSTQYSEKNVFLIAKRFCSMRCRFGFHFLSIDCLLGEREKERFIVFQFKGGAANLTRRIRRVHFVAELLAQFEFATEISGDILTARLEEGSEEQFLSALTVLGYLVMHTRQLDMIMGDEEALASHRFIMLEDMLRLACLPPLDLSAPEI
ncbi:hypothetical protein LJC59_08100 [Desulfovibrio sp. OttesenSCG-928-A18]|nr:hypothetical protein [Desulfovibrio sp. OttesenSCG-928-A18]